MFNPQAFIPNSLPDNTKYALYARFKFDGADNLVKKMRKSAKQQAYAAVPWDAFRADILLEARILCVADVVEAMSSHRPYRPALGVGAALEEIVQKRGILYDRDVVDSCQKIFREKLFKFD